MTTPNFEYTCYHCGQLCGGMNEGGYGAITGLDGAIHASCSPDDPDKRPDCHRRVTEFGETPGVLVDVDPKPVGVEGIRGLPMLADNNCPHPVISSTKEHSNALNQTSTKQGPTYPVDEIEAKRLDLNTDTLELINTEITASLARQVDAGGSVDNKSIVLVGYAVAASSFLATHHAQPVLAALAYLAYVTASGFGIWTYAVRLYLDVPTPRRLLDRYLDQPRSETLAALAATRVEAFEQNAAKYRRKANRWLISLISLVIGSTAMLLSLTSAYWRL